MLELNDANYYSNEANRDYWSVSQFKSFLNCEAAALAEINGEYEREMTESLMVGSYVDAYFSGESEQFKVEHPEMFTKQNELKAAYKNADKIIDRICQDPLFIKYISGRPQVIKTGELFGYPWKIKMDSYHEGDKIVDLKTMRSMEDVYVDGQGKMSFIEAWGYDIQGAVYQAIEGNHLPFYLAVATKEKETDIEVIQLAQNRLDTALKIVEHKIDRFADVKAGIEPPIRCEKCAYCRRTRKLKEPIVWGEEI